MVAAVFHTFQDARGAVYILCFYNNVSFVRVAFLGQPGRLLHFSCLNSVHDGAHATTVFSLMLKCGLQIVSLCFTEHKKSTGGFMMGCAGSTFHYMLICISHTSSR
jgi:hypothetical protein